MSELLPDAVHRPIEVAHQRYGWSDIKVGFLVFAMWIGCVVSCMFWLGSYSNAAGPEPVAPAMIQPAESGRKQLLLFVHPQCPCTVATVRQLERMLSTLAPNDRPEMKVFAYVPLERPENWLNCTTIEVVNRIGDIAVIEDQDGQHARAHGASTSGTALVYSAQGKLEFQGGLNSQRGHEGDSIGSLAIVELLSGVETTVRKTPVFGCQIFE